MTKAATLTLWIPRVAGVAVSLFLALFALDAFSSGKPFLQAVLDFVIHLAPAAVVLVIVALAWRLPLIGAAAFAALAIGYSVMANGRLDWIAAISGPLAVVAVLFLVSGLRRAA